MNREYEVEQMLDKQRETMFARISRCIKCHCCALNDDAAADNDD